MNYQVLKDEITNDPLARGYSGMTDQQIVDSLNTEDRERNKTSLTGSEVMNAIDKAEFQALPAADEATVWNILHLGTINPFGVEKDIMVDLFGAGSDTIAALALIRVEAISRGVELVLGVVNEGDVIMSGEQ